MQKTRIVNGAYGMDGTHEFRVVDQREAQVQIEYVEDGAKAWFQTNRFERSDTGSLILR